MIYLSIDFLTHRPLTKSFESNYTLNCGIHNPATFRCTSVSPYPFANQRGRNQPCKTETELPSEEKPSVTFKTDPINNNTRQEFDLLKRKNLIIPLIVSRVVHGSFSSNTQYILCTNNFSRERLLITKDGKLTIQPTLLHYDVGVDGPLAFGYLCTNDAYSRSERTMSSVSSGTQFHNLSLFENYQNSSKERLHFVPGCEADNSIRGQSIIHFVEDYRTAPHFMLTRLRDKNGLSSSGTVQIPLPPVSDERFPGIISYLSSAGVCWGQDIILVKSSQRGATVYRMTKDLKKNVWMTQLNSDNSHFLAANVITGYDRSTYSSLFSEHLNVLPNCLISIVVDYYI